MKFLLCITAFAAAAVAVRVTSPTQQDGWDTKGSEKIEWTSVSTDPKQCDIVLITPSDNDGTTIAKNVSISDESYIYTPSSDLSAGDGYRINLIANGGILAQSNQFNVTEGTSSVTPTSSMPSSTSSGSSKTSGSSSSASASKTSGAASHLVAPGSLAVLILGAVGALA